MDRAQRGKLSKQSSRFENELLILKTQFYDDEEGCFLMTNSRMNPMVDEYLSKAKKWQEEFEKLRMIILGCQLTEELKWGVPCYMMPTVF